ncbi:hypothetical protein [Fusobacterium sp. PH5-44]|uniref:hypothetical protein n=1 Tax=unclassified Fusobacterium TaxID=2648384 RepID=UPI003D226CDB
MGFGYTIQCSACKNKEEIYFGWGFSAYIMLYYDEQTGDYSLRSYEILGCNHDLSKLKKTESYRKDELLFKELYGYVEINEKNFESKINKLCCHKCLKKALSIIGYCLWD